MSNTTKYSLRDIKNLQRIQLAIDAERLFRFCVNVSCFTSLDFVRVEIDLELQAHGNRLFVVFLRSHITFN